MTGSPVSGEIQKEVPDTSDRIFLYETSSGERVFRQASSVIVQLPPGRKTLASSHYNGGYREDLGYVFNHQPVQHASHSHGSSASLEGESVSGYIRLIAERLGLDPEKTTGLLTAANMDNVAICTRSFRDTEVTAVVTAGVEVNGGRAGDPASYYQEDERFEMVGGTINTILLIGADLPAYSMVNAVVTATEAKTAVLQELIAPSRYSRGIATGSGTDTIAVIADGTGRVHLTDAGKHSKLGELIGVCVMEATKQALAMQSELTAQSQCDMLTRLERFGIDENNYWKAASMLGGENRKKRFISDLRDIAGNPALVAATASVLHIIDEVSWGLVPEIAGRRAAFATIKGLPGILHATETPPFGALLDERDSILDNWVRATAWLVKNGGCGVSG
jgi:adenosylcobinamide hydrolase